MAENEYRCEACNGIMEFDAATQMLKCPNCDNQIPVFSEKEQVEIHNLTLDARRMNQPSQKATRTMECSGCGAHIEVAGNETAARCPYCDSTYVLAGEQEATLIPDGLLPFQIDKKDLGQKFGQWMKKKWLAPGELKNLYQRDQFQGLYIPYWGFDADADCSYTAMGGRRRTVHYKDSNGEDKTRVETDWYHTHGRIRHNFKDVKIPASARFKKGLFKGVEPFHFEQLKPYSPDYFSGYMSENYSIGLEEGHRDAVLEMRSQLTKMAADDVTRRYDTVKDIRIRADFSNETYKYVMLPIYATTYSYKDKKYTVLVNGQTGKFHGEYPKSPVKIAILVVIILLALLAVYAGSNKNNDRGMLPEETQLEAFAADQCFAEAKEEQCFEIPAGDLQCEPVQDSNGYIYTFEL